MNDDSNHPGARRAKDLGYRVKVRTPPKPTPAPPAAAQPAPATPSPAPQAPQAPYYQQPAQPPPAVPAAPPYYQQPTQPLPEYNLADIPAMWDQEKQELSNTLFESLLVNTDYDGNTVRCRECIHHPGADMFCQAGRRHATQQPKKCKGYLPFYYNPEPAA